ncbi:MAG: DUF5009 domain-containing protein [Phycisphaeraceae bacterium]
MRQTEPATPDPPRRALGLDALRGLAILLMCLSGVVPNWLPNAMYHGYYPRYLPNDAGTWQRVANPWQFRGDWPSFTWVDWVFPMFLFAMGAAIPLAMSRKLGKGVPRWRLVPAVVWRWLVLIGFAVYVRQIDPYVIHPKPTTSAWLLAIAGFVLLFPVLMRLPRKLSRRQTIAIRCAGVAACVGLVCYLNARPGKAFAWSQHDIIILLLAHCSLFAALAWLVLPRRAVARTLALLAVFFVPHHQAMKADWRLLSNRLDFLSGPLNAPKRWLDFGPLADRFNGRVPSGWLDLGVLWDYTWLKFMWVVVPGLAVGDLLQRAMQRQDDDASRVDQLRWGGPRLGAIALLLTAVVVLAIAGAKDHGQVLLTLLGFDVLTPYAAILLAGPALIGAGLVSLKPRHADDRLLVSLYAWGTALLVAGLLLNIAPQLRVTPAGEPPRVTIDRATIFEGGIKKGPPATLSYYLTSGGLSVLALAVLTVLVDRWRAGRRVLGLLVFNGQNPMLAYAGIRSLLLPIVKLPLLVPIGLAGVKTLDDLGFLWFPRQIADWRNQAGLADEPWLAFAWSVVKTLALGVFVVLMTKLKIVWRS